VRISGFHVDGFGTLADFGIEDLSPGLVILSGPNEAGKSTLLDFLTGTLFGFPSRRDNPRFRAPVRGGRHGGWLTLREGSDQHDDAGPWRVERYAQPRRELAIRRPGGGAASEEDLRHALGGADEALFRAVFAVDLTDLGSAEAVTRDEVRELLFSASILGQRRSAARAMANLHKRRLELARSRQGDAQANRLLGELDSVRHSLAEAAREAVGYSARRAELARLELRVAEARDEADRVDHRTQDIDLLVRLWDVLERKRAAEERLAAWQEPGPRATWLEENASEIQSLRSACSGHLERVKQLADLCNQRGGIEQSIQSALGSLGPGWDRDRVRDGGGWIGLTDEGRRFRAILADRQSQWRAASTVAEEADAAPELSGLPDLDGAAISSATDSSLDADPERQARMVRELRKNLAEQRRLGAERRLDERPGGYFEALGRTTSISIATAALLITVLGVASALVADAPTVRLLCAGLAAAGCALLAVTLVARRRLSAKGPVAELASLLGLPKIPSDSDIETVAEEIEASRNLERSLEDDRRRTTAALGRRKVAHESLARASEELENERARFAAWKAAHGLGTSLSPDGVLESLAALQSIWDHLGALDRVNTKIDGLRRDVAGFADRLAGLAGGFRERAGRLESSEADPAGTLDTLFASLEEVLSSQAARRALSEVAEGAQSELERSLGLGARSRILRAELEAGELLAWTEEQNQLSQSRSEVRQGLEELVRAHQDASNELRELASSTRIAELDQRRHSLESELDEVLKSWALLGCARLLLERTLRRHEKERQPAVLARAGELFAKVTQGRYRSLLPSVGDENSSQAIRVVTSSGAEIEASSLSRGSIEQLYLCLRIGLAETFAERSEALPLILDDVLVNFDPSRAAAVVEVLAETAARHQVLFFTCHPHLRDLVQSVAPHAQVVELERV
jgi:uncharacterized protein YhaN